MNCGFSVTKKNFEYFFRKGLTLMQKLTIIFCDRIVTIHTPIESPDKQNVASVTKIVTGNGGVRYGIGDKFGTSTV